MLTDSNRLLCYFRPSPDNTRILFGGRPAYTDIGPKLAAQRLRHVGQARLGLVDVGRRGLRLVITPALKGAHRPRRDGDDIAVEPHFAAADPVGIPERLDADDFLPRRDLALDDPVERASVENVRRALRGHAGDVGVAERRAAALRLGHARRHPLAKVVEGIRADAKLDEMQGHGGDYSREAALARARVGRYPRIMLAGATLRASQ